MASWRTCFRVNLFFINPTGWPHLRGRFGVHPTPVSEFYRIFTIYVASFMTFYKVVPERFRRRFGNLCGTLAGQHHPATARVDWHHAHSWSGGWIEGLRHVLFLSLFYFINPTGWPHLWGRFGMHPRPVPEFSGILQFYVTGFMPFYKVVPERFERRFGGLGGLLTRGHRPTSACAHLYDIVGQPKGQAGGIRHAFI